MNTSPDTLDQLALSYLDAVDRGLTGLPEDRRKELLDDLGNHIAAERAALGQPTEAAMRAVLDRLGDPETLATEARLAEDSPLTPSATIAAARQPRMPRLGPRGWLLLILGLAFLAFLLFGVAVTSRGGVSPAPAPTSTGVQPSPSPR